MWKPHETGLCLSDDQQGANLLFSLGAMVNIYSNLQNIIINDNKDNLYMQISMSVDLQSNGLSLQ